MSPPKVHIVDMEGLAELLEEFAGEERLVSTEEAERRFGEACRLAYGVTRTAVEAEAKLIDKLIGSAHINTVQSDGVDAAAGCLIMQAACEYLQIDQQKDPERFKTQFIFCLDKAVQMAGEGMRETHDARTKQSAKERAAQSPATS